MRHVAWGRRELVWRNNSSKHIWSMVEARHIIGRDQRAQKWQRGTLNSTDHGSSGGTCLVASFRPSHQASIALRTLIPSICGSFGDEKPWNFVQKRAQDLGWNASACERTTSDKNPSKSEGLRSCRNAKSWGAFHHLFGRSAAKQRALWATHVRGAWKEFAFNTAHVTGDLRDANRILIRPAFDNLNPQNVQTHKTLPAESPRHTPTSWSAPVGRYHPDILQSCALKGVHHLPGCTHPA